MNLFCKQSLFENQKFVIMKKFIALLALMSISFGVSGQTLDIFNATVTKVGDKYQIRDTLGSATNLQITFVELDSADFVQQYFDVVYAGLRQISNARMMAVLKNREVSKYKQLLTSQGLLAPYLEYIDNLQNYSGMNVSVEYNGTKANLTFGPDENLYTQGGAKVVNVLEIADNWLRFRLITQNNEVIEVDRVEQGVWLGVGVNGNLIVRLQ